MKAAYDDIVKQYKKYRKKSLTRPIVLNTLMHLVGDVKGKTFIDLGCGEGCWTRTIMRIGALKAVGVDISKEMIDLASHQEKEEPSGIEYICRDVCGLGKIGEFDLVIANYLLNHAQTKEQLIEMCKSIYANLKPGCRFIGLNNSLELSPRFYPHLERYGIRMRVQNASETLKEGDAIKITLFCDDIEFSITDYYLSRSTYESALKSAGFKDIRWHQPVIPDEVIQLHGREFWQNYIDYPPIIGIECTK
jgi:toxoflavin synthase